MNLISINPAFEFLRKHKQVSPETEELVMEKIGDAISTADLVKCFQNGISGEYGKVYSADVQTLVSWVRAFTGKKTGPGKYREEALLNPNNKHFEKNNESWLQEANKCLTAFLSGVHESNFHPHVYDRMMLDGKIPINACMRYLGKNYTEQDVIAAKQKTLAECFDFYKKRGWTDVYLEV